MENRPSIWNGIHVPYEASVDELARQIDGTAPNRWAAFVALAYTPGDSALALLRVGAGSSDPHVRRIAAEAIGIHREGRQLGATIGTLLGDSYAFVVRAACEAAARHRLEHAHDAIVRLLHAPEESTCVAALRALRQLWQEVDFDEVFRMSASDWIRGSAEGGGVDAAIHCRGDELASVV